MSESPERLSVKEVADELKSRGFNVNERGVRRQITKKQLRSTKINNIHYVERKDLETFIRARETMPSQGDLALAG